MIGVGFEKRSNFGQNFICESVGNANKIDNKKMRKPLLIGDRLFQTKKEALNHYKVILNSYNFGQSLSDEDYDDVFDLIKYDESFDEQEPDEIDEDESKDEVEEYEEDVFVKDIKVSRVQFNTKCFEVILSDSSTYYISYLMKINRHRRSYDLIFNTACRSAVQNDLRAVKQQYFDRNSVKGRVRCQETNELLKWEDLNVDHRQPNTFSVIVDRFKEAFAIDTATIDYFTDENNLLAFEDKVLAERFRIYHKDKASLRIVKKERNLSRTGMARVKRSEKDLVVK